MIFNPTKELSRLGFGLVFSICNRPECLNGLFGSTLSNKHGFGISIVNPIKRNILYKYKIIELSGIFYQQHLKNYNPLFETHNVYKEKKNCLQAITNVKAR